MFEAEEMFCVSAGVFALTKMCVLNLFFCSCARVCPPGECRQLQCELLGRLSCSQFGSLQRRGETQTHTFYTLYICEDPHWLDALPGPWCLLPNSNLKPEGLNPLSSFEEVRKVSTPFQKCPPFEAGGGPPCAREISMHWSRGEEISNEITCSSDWLEWTLQTVFSP